jgi:hypothetical protein
MRDLKNRRRNIIGKSFSAREMCARLSGFSPGGNDAIKE